MQCCRSAIDVAELFILLSLDQVQHTLKFIAFFRRDIPMTSERRPFLGRQRWGVELPLKEFTYVPAYRYLRL